MRYAAIFLSLLACSGQPQPFSPAVFGTAKEIKSDRILVQTSSRNPVLFYANADSKIWRGKAGHLLSVVQPGDQVDIRYWRETNGRLTILELSANADHIWGVISKVGSGRMEVDQNFNADPHSSYVRRLREIRFDSDTKFEDSTPEDLRVGRIIDVFGARTTRSTTYATRVVVYDGNTPMRLSPGTRVKAPNGTVQTH